MAEDSQKRFQDAMDKLFRTPPKSNSSSPSRVQLSRGRKRPDMSVIGKGVGKQNLLLGSSKGGCSGEGKAPCRPWDRDDLFRRMSTFKSMTWFAKPQAISAVNCARRGWVNVDMDTIACEACGSRMLFSTPPSWTQQQVDKAASVFSLKLDSGHKLLCPWIDNACDEKLADFPPTVTAVLVDQYKIRHSVLSQLAALPVISAKAIDFLKNPQLEQFLRESLTVELDGSMQTPQQEDTRNESTSASSLTYYQAQKLISLCGWELRSLPYFVDPKDQPNQSSKDANISDKSILSGKSQTITPYSSCTDKTSEKKPDDDNQASEEAVINPNSVVLDCKLCGACIGLWDFSMVSRPLEFLRVSGYTQVNNDHITGDGKSLLSGNSDHDESRERIGHVATSANTMLDRGPPNFNLTIAGGPPPAMHNYRAKISLPIIGRNLRAWFSSESEHKDDLVTKCSSDLSKNPECLAGENTAEGTSLSTSEAITEAQLENSQAAAQDSGNITEMADNAESLNKVDPAVMDHCKDKVGNDFGLSGKDSELQILSADKALEFDPFKLHRYFCPWIASNGGSPPGWEQTLSALDRHAESSPLSSFAPSSLIKVGDPVASVQKLFTSVQPKRRKLVRPS
ncbi:hypothetical protein T459_10838 [Capsicum annuum]|uniref:C3HC-type domain-containing protein n=1 Tax=Capsicum annuum TaxID=4072 RepID=A0A2G3A3D2_CAPAN|nr:hypothetical protein T459_10838 [Capsicum annuum]